MRRGWDPSVEPLPFGVQEELAILLDGQEIPTNSTISAEEYIKSVSAGININILKRVARQQSVEAPSTGSTRAQWLAAVVDSLVQHE